MIFCGDGGKTEGGEGGEATTNEWAIREELE